MERGRNMRPVEGFLSDDGNFFESAVAARLHDAEMAIRAYCVTHTADGKDVSHTDKVASDAFVEMPLCIDADKLLPIIEALAEPIMEYLNAHKEASASQSQINEERVAYPEASETRKHQEDGTTSS